MGAEWRWGSLSWDGVVAGECIYTGILSVMAGFNSYSEWNRCLASVYVEHASIAFFQPLEFLLRGYKGYLQEPPIHHTIQAFG